MDFVNKRPLLSNFLKGRHLVLLLLCFGITSIDYSPTTRKQLPPELKLDYFEETSERSRITLLILGANKERNEIIDIQFVKETGNFEVRYAFDMDGDRRYEVQEEGFEVKATDEQ